MAPIYVLNLQVTNVDSFIRGQVKMENLIYQSSNHLTLASHFGHVSAVNQVLLSTLVLSFYNHGPALVVCLVGFTTCSESFSSKVETKQQGLVGNNTVGYEHV